MKIPEKYLVVFVSAFIFSFGFFTSAHAQYRIEVDPVGTDWDCATTCNGDAPCRYGVYCRDRDSRYGLRCILTDQRPKFYTKKCKIWDKGRQRFLGLDDYRPPPPPPPPGGGTTGGGGTTAGGGTSGVPYCPTQSCSPGGWRRSDPSCRTLGTPPKPKACPAGYPFTRGRATTCCYTRP